MKNILKWNPEFARNLWLELSVQRLIAMPAIIFIVIALIFTNASSVKGAWETTHYVALSGFVIVGLLWGIKTSADAVLDENNEKTWDWQKMSIIGPWKLAFGKLFGSTIYNWYGAAICWVLFMVSIPYTDHPENEVKTGILLIISMISLHGLMIMIALQMIRKSDGRTKIKSNRIFISGIIFLAFLSRILSLSFLLNKTTIDFSWYGFSTNATDMSIISAAFYCAWVIAGLYRSMRAELQFSDTPVWWITFLISNFVFQYGFFVSNESFSGITGIAACLTLVFLETLFIVYFLSLSEAKDIVNFRFLQTAWQGKEYTNFFKNIPLWLISLPVAFVFGILAVIFLGLSTYNTQLVDVLHELKISNTGELFLFLIATMGFVVRDLGILLLLNFSTRPKRADTAMMVYLLLLYVLLPILTKNLGIASIFYPHFESGMVATIVSPLLEASVVLFFLVKRWREMNSANVIA